MLLAAVFLLSFSSLSFEVLLARFFSISQWNHLSFMVISIALFGFAASGIFLNLVSIRHPGWENRLTEEKWITRFVLLFFLSAFGSYMAVNAIPLDYFRIPFDLLQIVYLFITFLLLSFPFFFAGLVSALAYASHPQRTGFIYFLSMLGSTCGALLPIPLLPFFGPGGCILISAFIPLFLLLYADVNLPLKCIAGGIFGVILIFFLTWNNGSLVDVNPSAYKTLPQLLQLPETHIIETHHSIRGRIDVVECPSIRFAPGLSLKYRGTMPEQHAVIRDADDQLTLYAIDPEDPPDLPAYTLPFSGYTLFKEPEDVLIIQRGGGTGILSAFRSRAPHIVVVEEHPWIAHYVRAFYTTNRCEIICESGREFLSRTTELFDVIQVESWGTSIPVMASLNEEYLFTIDAFTQYYERLKPDGLLIIARKLLTPPSDLLRVSAAAYTALSRRGIIRPLRHIMLLKYWDIYTLLLSPSPFTDERIHRIREFCGSMNFDLLYYDGIDPAETNRFVLSETHAHFNAISSLFHNREAMEDFYHNYYLSVSPQTDNKPFHSNFLRWDRIWDLYKSTGERSYTLILSGELIVWVVFLTALLIGFFLLILPVTVVPKKEHRYSPLKLLYFLGVGAGFMFIEIAFIKEYTFLSGEPVVALSFVLCLVLVFSGIGGFLSSRLHKKTIPLLLLILIGMNLLMFFIIETSGHFIIKLHPVIRYCCMGLLLLPISLLMGIPFPCGMKIILEHPIGRAYSWAANGSASVISSIIAVPSAMGMGIDFLFICSGIAYAVTLTAFLLIEMKKGRSNITLFRTHV
jgi:hypothetical protein